MTRLKLLKFVWSRVVKGGSDRGGNNHQAKEKPMLRNPFIMKMIRVLALIGSLIFAYLYFLKPWYNRWGATDAEVDMALPGDNIIPDVDWGYTQSINIHAPAAPVWQWLVQIGQDRGGFYSYELLENISGCDIHNADRIIPEFQNLATGDHIKLHPDFPGIPVRVIEPEKAIVLGGKFENNGDAVIWGFFINKLNDNTTRLISRSHISYSHTLHNFLMHHIFIEPASFLLQKRMLIGIKQRAEGTFISSVPDYIQVLLWIILFVIFVISIMGTLFRKYWGRTFFVGLVAGLLLLLLTAWQPQIWISSVLVVNIFAAAIWSFR